MDVDPPIRNGEDSLSRDPVDILSDSQNSQLTPPTSTPAPRKKSKPRSQVCEFLDSDKEQVQCKQRAIVSYRFCIRHILADPNAPYKRCAEMIKSKSMKQQCTNAIKKDAATPYCSTHLIMRGEKKPKRKKKPEDAVTADGVGPASQSNTQDSSSVADDEPATNVSDVDFNDFGKSPREMMANNDFTIPPLTNGLRPPEHPNENLLLHPQHQVPVTTTPTSLDSTSTSYHERIRSPGGLLNKQLQQEVIIPLENGTVGQPVVIPLQNPQFLTHYVQRTSTKTEIFDSPDYPVNGTANKLHRPIIDGVERVEMGPTNFVAFPRPEFADLPDRQLKPTIHILPLKSPLEFIDRHPPPVFYDVNSIRADDETTEIEKLKRDYLNNGNDNTTRKKSSVIKLRQKRRRIRTDGKFRAIPAVDAMCQLIEDYDFDGTDLFPLGLEPSDDEESSDDELTFSHLPRVTVNPNDMRASRLELYLMKKRLRRESEKLQRNAKLSLAVMHATRSCPDSVGAAFRMRKLYRRRRNLNGLSSALNQCFHIDRDTHSRCSNICVPRSTMCVDHIAFSVDQRAFSFCTTPCCGRPVSKLNAIVFKGMCEEHYNGNHMRQTQNEVISNGHLHRLPIATPALTTTIVEHNHVSTEVVAPDNYADHQLMNSITMDDFNLTDVVEGDVSLASVANELMFEPSMLDLLQTADESGAVDGANNDLEDTEGLHGIEDEESWADIGEFLRSEGFGHSSEEHEFGNSVHNRNY
ncbi:KAT8 regulatory NSL complex subunit 2 [Aphelenchoides besseyi]|nr:KAT8 regulatory NSL complex subunit 2 [Aphelenchoides besseyi]KAI6209661.1 KAT8 regulatory NSL complex subunit 2 [Aphelenchoides besseyi]